MTIDELLEDAGFRAVVTQFVDKLQQRVRTIEEAVRSGDLDAAERAAHQLAGVGGGFGFGQISRYALAVERCIQGRSSANSRQKAVASLRAEAEKALADWEEEVPTVVAS